MSRVLTGNKIIDSIRKRAMIPNDTSVFTDQDILDILNEELDVQVLEKLLTLHEEHLVTHIDIPKNASGEYEIPYRAIGNKIREVSIVNGSGKSAYVYELSRVGIGELPDFRNDTDSNAYLDKFYVEGTKIKLINPTRSFDSIRMYFYMRPSVLTKTDQAGVIINISDDGVNATLAMSPVGKSFTENKEYDIVGKRTPNSIKAYDLTAVSGGLTTGTTGSIIIPLSQLGDSYNDIKVGDYVTIAEQTPVPNIPTELHPILAQASAMHILEALGDTEALQNAEKRMMNMVNSVQSLVDDRVELAPKKIKPRHSTLAQALGMNRKNRGRY